MRLSTVVVLSLLTSSLRAAETVTLTYEDLPRWVTERNSAVASAHLAVQAAEARTGVLARSWTPQLIATGGAERFKTGGFATTNQPYGWGEASLNVFQGGKNVLEEKRRVAEVENMATERERLKRDILQEARSLYWQLVAEQERVAMLEQLLERSAENQKAAQRRVNRGLTTDTETLAIDLYSQQLREQQESARHEMEILSIKLAARLQTAEGARFTTEPTVPHVHDDALLAWKPQGQESPEVRHWRAQADLQRARGRQESRWWTPAIDLYGQAGQYTLRDRSFASASDRRDWATGVRARLSLFDGGEAHRESVSGMRRAEAAERRVRYEESLHIAEARSAQEELKHLHELIHNADQHLERSRTLLKRMLSEYDRGVRTSQDMLAAIERLASLQNQHLNRRLEYQRTKARLLALVGL